MRVSEPFAERQARTWMVAREDLRSVPRIRAVIDRLRQMFRDYAPLFEGKRPIV